MTPRRFKCSQFRKGNLDFNFECTKLLQNDFPKQRYITLNATIPGQDRINPKTHLCRTFFAEYSKTGVYKGLHYFLIFALKHILWVHVRTASSIIAACAFIVTEKTAVYMYVSNQY